MKKLLFLLPISLLLLLATSCGDDTAVLPAPETGNVNLTFKAMFGDEELDFNSTNYDYEGQLMRISKFDFFISNVGLYKDIDGANDDVTELFEIEFVDLTQNNNSVTIENESIAMGEYDGIVFRIGVPSDLNNQIPNDFSNTHPLGIAAQGSHYWQTWGSYIFSKLEGKLGNLSEDDIAFSYHTGSDDFYSVKIEKSHPINLASGATETINFEFDLERIFLTGGALDIATYPNSHSLSETTAATHVVNSYTNSIKVK